MKNIARRTVVLFAIILICAGTTAHAAGVDMKEGQWETSTETSMMMEGMSMPPMAAKSTYCLTRENPVPKSEKDKDCKMVKLNFVGNTVSWRMECKKAEGEGEITYRGSTYNGSFRMKMVEDGQTMTMNTTPRITKITASVQKIPRYLPMMNDRRPIGLDNTVRAVFPSISSEIEVLAAQMA